MEPQQEQAAQDGAPVSAAPAQEGRSVKSLTSSFNRTVRAAQAAIFAERLVPRLVPPLCTGGLFLSVSWLGLWAALPPVACAAGVLTFAAALVASPFLVKSGSLIVTQEDALRRLDKNLGEPSRPAQALRDTLDDKNPPVAKQVWDLHIQDLWKRWGERFSAGRPKVEIQKHDPYRIRYGVAALTLAAGLFAGGQWFDRLSDAFNWQAPPPPPMEVRAWVTPPQHIMEAPLYLTEATRDHTQGGEKLVAHQNSTLTILTYEPEAKVLVNGIALEVQKIIPAQGSGEKAKAAYQYEAPLTQENTSIVITNGPQWQFEVTPDHAPLAVINTIDPDAKNVKALSIIYQAKDDYGVQEGRLQITPVVPADKGAVPLPSLQLPPLNIR